jgi:hypothetical protein
MIRYVVFAAAAALGAACLSACAMNWGYRDPSPGDRHDDSASSSDAAYSSQLSVINRRACHEKQEKNCD